MLSLPTETELMMEAIHKKRDIILSYEESFARAIAQAMVVRRPITVWHFLIPFIFIFHLLRMKREVESFTKNFLYTKKITLDAALDINKGEDRQNRLSRIEDETRGWLIAHDLHSWGIHQGQMAQVNLLVDHYLKLLDAEGDSYSSLVRNTYKTRKEYESFLNQLNSIGREIDRAVYEILPGNKEKAWEQILISRQ